MVQSQRVILDFCNSNLMSFTQDLFLELRAEHPDWTISKYGCLTNCGECAVRPFAILNDEIVAAETAEELREKILAIVSESAK